MFDFLLAVNEPTIQTRPAIQDGRTDLLIAGLPVPVVDLTVHGLNPSRVSSRPGFVLPGLGDKRGKVAHVFGHCLDKVHVDPKMEMAILKRRDHLGRADYQIRLSPVCICVDRKAIAVVGSQGPEDIAEIIDPVSIGVAGIDRLGVPGRHGSYQDKVILMSRQTFDRIATQAIAACVEFRRDYFAGADDGASRRTNFTRFVRQR